MKRRQYLASLTLAVGVAGCLESGSSGTTTNPNGGGGTDSGSPAPTDQPVTDTPTSQPTDTTAVTTATPAGPRDVPVPTNVDLPIERSSLSRGAAKDAIPAIVDPVFDTDWKGVESFGEKLSLRDDDRVIGVARKGRARAYPLRILNWHEIVNDNFAGPLLVTYCPLCGSGVTAKRTVNGKETRFGVSGLLWQSDLVMYDQRTSSLWSQILATAINGPKTGTQLQLLPSTLTTWGKWTETHPETKVLRPPPESGTIGDATGRNYGANPYDGYSDSSRIGIGNNQLEDDRLHAKALVIGVTHDGTAKAYARKTIGTNATVTDDVSGLPIVVTTDGSGSLYAYERTVDGETLTFENEDPSHLRGGGSRWTKVSGKAVDGPHEGTTLVRANDRSQMFWFAWVDFHPETKLYGDG